MPKVSGSCNERLARYYYDGATYKCRMFLFFGCAGNSNNFESLEECGWTCEKGNMRNGLLNFVCEFNIRNLKGT